MGVEIVRGEATLSGPNEVSVHGHAPLPTRVVLLCTGSRPRRLDVPGLARAGSLTSDDVFALDTPPATTSIVGGGPVGVELAQAFNRLGIAATVVERAPTILPRDEPGLVRRLSTCSTREGVQLHTAADVRRVTTDGQSRSCTPPSTGNPRPSGATRCWSPSVAPRTSKASASRSWA